jgi:multidrug efflux pump subunit AcrA (membrane-fusion protein)
MKKWIIIIIAVVVIAGGFFLFNWFRNRQATASANFQTAAAERGSLTGTVGATGLVRANQSAPLSWQTTGTVGEVNVAAGNQVQVGDVLATLEKTSLSQAVILAQADLVNAEKALNDLRTSQIQQAQALKTVEDAKQTLEDANNPELLQARALEALAAAQKNVENAERSLRWAQSPANQSYVDEAKAQVTLAKDLKKSTPLTRISPKIA